MTVLGRCPRPALSPPGRPPAQNDGAGGGGSCGAAPVPADKGIARSSERHRGLAKGHNDGRAGVRAVKVKHLPGLFWRTHLSGPEP